MYEHRFKTSVSNGDHIYDERGNRLWNGMLFSSKKALLLNYIYTKTKHTVVRYVYVEIKRIIIKPMLAPPGEENSAPG
jgi:hypothetical protein